MTVGLSPFPTPVPTRDDPDNFDERADATLAHLPVFVDELNASIAGIDQAVAAAAGSKSAAATSASEAASSVTKASRWSDAAVGVVVEAGRYSARHWSDVADRFANAAKGVEVTPGKYSAFHWSEMAKDIANVVAYTVAFTPVQNLKSTNVQAALAEVDAAADYLRALALRAAYGSGPYPAIDIQFVGATMLDPRVTLTRASVKTVINRLGMLETVPANAPAFAFDPATGRSLGLSVESRATNLLLWSSDFTKAVWQTSGLARSAHDAKGWSKLSETGAVGSHFMFQQTADAATSQHVVSFILKRAERRYAQIRLNAVGGGSTADHVRVVFDLLLGLVTETIASGQGSEALGRIVASHDGGWECSVTGIPGGPVEGTVRASLFLMENPTGTSVYGGDGVSGIYVRAAQMELGSTVSSYIPTQASQATRAPDDPRVVGDRFASAFNPEEGTFVVRGSTPPTRGINPLLSADDGTASNRIQIRQSTSNNRPTFVLAVQSELFVNESLDLAWPPGSSAVAAISYTRAAAVYGFAGKSFTKPSAVPAINQLSIGTAQSFSQSTAFVESVQYYPRAFSAARIEALTA